MSGRQEAGPVIWESPPFAQERSPNSGNIVNPDTLPVDQHRHRVGAVVLDAAGRGVVGADDNDAVLLSARSGGSTASTFSIKVLFWVASPSWPDSSAPLMFTRTKSFVLSSLAAAVIFPLILLSCEPVIPSTGTGQDRLHSRYR